MSDETLIDIAGNEIAPGDDVVYPQMSGRSVQMVRGKLVSYNGKTAQIERAEGSRWSASYNRTRYRDKRTGKGIDPYTASRKHYKVKPSHTFTNKETGEVLRAFDGEEASPEYKQVYETLYGWNFYGREAAREQWASDYHRGEFHDYVEEYTDEPKPVTIHNVSNIVKVTVSDDSNV